MSEIEARIAAALAPEPEPAPEPAETEPALLQAAQEPAEAAPEAVDTIDSEAAPEGEPVEDTETIEVDSLDDFATHFGVEKADLYNLKIPITMADGQRSEVTLGEWKDSYRNHDELARETRKTAEARQQLETQQALMQNAFQEKVRSADAALTVAEQQVVNEYHAIDWATLRQQDPAEWAAARQNIQERMASIKNSKQELENRWHQEQQQNQHEQQQQIAQILETERASLLQALPSWQDENVAKAERSQLSEYLRSSGFNESEVGSVADHRLVVMANKARLYDESLKSTQAAKKRVVKIGKKTISPGTTRGKQTARDDRNAGLKRALKNSGKVDDAAALIRSRLTGS